MRPERTIPTLPTEVLAPRCWRTFQAPARAHVYSSIRKIYLVILSECSQHGAHFSSSAWINQTWTFGFLLDLRLKIEVEATLYTCNYLDDLFPPVRGSADVLMPFQWVSCQFSITENAYCTGDIVVLTALQTRVDHESSHGRFVQTDLCRACIPHVL